MHPLKVLAIYREKIFSNRAVEADKAILDAVVDLLKKSLGGGSVQ